MKGAGILAGLLLLCFVWTCRAQSKPLSLCAVHLAVTLLTCCTCIIPQIHHQFSELPSIILIPLKILAKVSMLLTVCSFVLSFCCGIAGEFVGVVPATDQEGDELRYSITSSTADSAYFSINSSSGVISISTPIDREVCDGIPQRGCIIYFMVAAILRSNGHLLS